MAEIQMPPRCPKCQRITVDNRQHCPKLTSSRWAVVCQWIRCLNPNCSWTYGPLDGKMVGFYPDGRYPR